MKVKFYCKCGIHLESDRVETFCGTCGTRFMWWEGKYREFEYAEIVTESKKEVREINGLGLTYRRKWCSV